MSELSDVAADIVIVGEVHDHPVHHRNQAKIAAQLRPMALVFEMLTPEQAQSALSVDRTDMAALEASLEWSQSGWPEFALYFPIFEAAPDAQIFGAAVSRETMRQAISTGAAAAFGQDADEFGLGETLDEDEHAARLALQDEAHCGALPAEMLPGMIEAQRLRDAAFARTALEALKVTRGPVLIITGNGHARTDWGVPLALRTAAPKVSVVSIGQVADPDTSMPFDRWIVSDALKRDSDPCDAFHSN
ncbi:MAG: ChaN family lipoprotein [Litoreibacter sp.]